MLGLDLSLRQVNMDSPMNATEDPWIWSCRWIYESYSVRCLSNGGLRINYLELFGRMNLEVFANVPLGNRGLPEFCLLTHSLIYSTDNISGAPHSPSTDTVVSHQKEANPSEIETLIGQS